MRKNDLVTHLQEKFNLRRYICEDVVDEFFNIIANTLAEGEPVTITGFGTFGVTKTSARTGRNPRTGEAIKIKARYRVGFKPGKGLKEKVNG